MNNLKTQMIPQTRQNSLQQNPTRCFRKIIPLLPGERKILKQFLPVTSIQKKLEPKNIFERFCNILNRKKNKFAKQIYTY